MDKRFILLCAVLFFQIRDSSENCVIKNVYGRQEYICNTIQELERFGNPNLLNVTVHKDGIVPTLEPHQMPNLKIVLLDEGNDGISSSTLQILTDLTRLLQRRSTIGRINRGVFENLPIKQLKLEENGINNIERGAFNNMTKLEDLQIVKNNLRTVENGVFNGLPVEILALSNNRIYTIKRNAFNDMKNLKHLYLDGNVLNEFLPEFVLNYGVKMTTLNLNGNLFTELNPTTVRGLDNLNMLNLGNNNISKIFSYTFDSMVDLENLILSENKLHDLSADIFPQNGLQKLQKLQLNDNRLSFLTITTLRRLKNLKYIRLGGNPWICSCFDELLQWLGRNDVQQKCDRHYFSGTRPYCVTVDDHATACDYSTDDFYYNTYHVINDKYPKGPECDL